MKKIEGYMNSNSKPLIHFDPFEKDHLAILRQWLNEPHVAEFWQESDNENEFKEKYLVQLKQRGVHSFIIRIENKLIGYIQYYDATSIGGGWWLNAINGTFGIDQFIGEPDFINKGLGSKIIRQFVELLFQKPEVMEVIADPDPLNLRAIKAYEKAGFKQVGLAKTPNGNAMIVKIERKQSKK